LKAQSVTHRKSSVVIGIGLFALGCFNAPADVVVIVSAKSAVETLTRAQVADLFLGKSTSFPGGTSAVPLDQSVGAAQREEFHAKVTEKTGSQLKFYWAKQVFQSKGLPPKEIKGDDAVRRLVADNPNFIGYVDRKAVNSSVKVVFEP
jgi:ABC-type phosphate transport system substrate-binding protein